MKRRNIWGHIRLHHETRFRNLDDYVKKNQKYSTLSLSTEGGSFLITRFIANLAQECRWNHSGTMALLLNQKRFTGNSGRLRGTVCPILIQGGPPMRQSILILFLILSLCCHSSALDIDIEHGHLTLGPDWKDMPITYFDHGPDDPTVNHEIENSTAKLQIVVRGNDSWDFSEAAIERLAKGRKMIKQVLKGVEFLSIHDTNFPATYLVFPSLKLEIMIGPLERSV